MSAIARVVDPTEWTRARAASGARKYGALAAIAFRQALSERAALLGRMAFYSLILFIFSRLWQAVPVESAVPGATMRELLWYLAITEWVLLSFPMIHMHIEADVRRGEIAYRLGRPVSYLGSRLAEACGEFALRAGSLAVVGCGLAWWMAGGLPQDPRGLVLAIPLGLLAAWVGVSFHAAIGFASFWLQDCQPVYWIWQKSAFILGGLLLPLDVYPAWLREIALASPFAAMMYGPGRMAFGWDPGGAAWVALQLVAWGLVATGLLYWIHRRALRVLDVNGG